MAYRVVTVKDGQVVSVHWNGPVPPARMPCTLNVGVFGQSAGGWPMKSDATGVNPDQIPEAMAADASRGVRVEYDRDTGAAVYNDASERKRHCESLGIVDRNGGYGDPQTGGIKKYEKEPGDC